MSTYKRGQWGEWLAGAWYVLQGYRILARRYKTKVGEIDLVAKRWNTLVFIEVKSHQTEESSLNSVTPLQQDRIQRAAQMFVAKNEKWQELDFRFDVAIVNWKLRPFPARFKVRCIKNAFIG